MKLTELERKLLAAARSNPPDEGVPYAFEQRVIARLRVPAALDPWALWGHGLWRAAALCVAVMVLLGGWSLLNRPGSAPANDLSQAFENTLLAAVDQDSSTDSTW